MYSLWCTALEYSIRSDSAVQQRTELVSQSLTISYKYHELISSYVVTESMRP